jgi:hypothetical protein
VIVESPYAGDIEANLAYARACVRDSLHRGEAPIASHLLHTQPGILRDEVPEERTLGREAGLAWCAVADLMAVYTDRGVSTGMRQAMQRAEALGLAVEMRSIESRSSEPTA